MKPLIAAAVVLLSELHQAPMRDPALQKPPASVAAGEGVPGLRVVSTSGDGLDVVADGCVAHAGVESMAASVSIYGPERIVPVRVEHLQEQDGAASLSIEHVFVDRRTRAAKSFRTETMDLKPVASFLAAAGDTRKVYAYRDDHFVHVVWPTADNCSHGHLRIDTADPNGPKSSAIARTWTATSTSPKSRRIRVSASLSKSTQDPEPILSVSVAVHATP
ncbi:hypothetical protein LZC95_05755 [Pendulispora brunnea]|uniref:Uncharacterized protein n=1 Tax=Pendulispora brunnea TaxID=2905690 RepID=A0ABZ2KCJ9_9BACT